MLVGDDCVTIHTNYGSVVSFSEYTMKVTGLKFLALSFFAVSLFGCNASTEPTNTVGNAEQSAIDAYESALAEEEGAMDEAPPSEDLEE